MLTLTHVCHGIDENCSPEADPRTPATFLRTILPATKQLTTDQEAAILSLVETSPKLLQEAFSASLCVVSGSVGRSGAALESLSQWQQQIVSRLFLHAAVSLRVAADSILELEQTSSDRLKLWAAGFVVHNNYYSRLREFSGNEGDQLRRDLLVCSAAIDQQDLFKVVIARLGCFREQLVQLAAEPAQQTHGLSKVSRNKQRSSAQLTLDLQSDKGSSPFPKAEEYPGASLSEYTEALVDAELQKLGTEALQGQVRKLELLQTAALAKAPITDALLSNRELLHQNPSLIVAHHHTLGIAEVYEVRTSVKSKAGALVKLGAVKAGRNSLPQYLSVKRETYCTKGHILTVQDNEPEPGWTVIRKGLSRIARSVPVRLIDSDLEQELSQALAEVDRLGGWWNALLTGQPPTPSVNKEGYRSANIMFAVAGLCCWYPHANSKGASWTTFPQAVLTNGRLLTLATCFLEPNSKLVSPGKAGTQSWFKQWAPHKDTLRVDIYAHEESPYWHRLLMWG